MVGVCPALAARPATITLLHVNDTHSHLDAWGPKDRHLDGTLGGMAKAASVIAAVRATEPNVLLLHAGDVFHGDLFFNEYFGVPELQLMKQLGFDAMAVGNHEFDFGPDVLADVARDGVRRRARCRCCRPTSTSPATRRLDDLDPAQHDQGGRRRRRSASSA